MSLYKEDDDVPCIVEPTTTYIERLLKIGRRFHNQYTKPESKRELIHSIMVQGYSSKDVKKETDLNVSRYIYRSTIPTEVIEQNSTLNNPVSPHTINIIDTLPSPITSKIKTYLINKALINQLTQAHIKNIKKMVKYSMEDFSNLSYTNQIKIIQYVISSPALLPHLWQNKIEQLKRRPYK